MVAEVHCSRVCVGWNLLFKSLCWLKPLVLKFVLAEISCSTGCRISPYFRVFKLLFRFHQLIIRLIVIKSIAGKKKKNPKIWSGSCSFLVLVLDLVLVLVLVLVLWLRSKHHFKGPRSSTNWAGYESTSKEVQGCTKRTHSRVMSSSKFVEAQWAWSTWATKNRYLDSSSRRIQSRLRIGKMYFRIILEG